MFNLRTQFGTTSGDFILNSTTGKDTFQATVGGTAVPEPSTLFGAGLASVAGLAYAWRRRRPATA